MLTHRGYSAWIVCDGQPLTEYEVNLDEKKNEVRCWIPSEAGKAFSVHWQDHGSGIWTSAYIHLDGYICSGRFLFGEGSTYREGLRTGRNTEAPFVFHELSNEPPDSSRDRSELGCVLLRIKQVERVAPYKNNKPQKPPQLVGGLRRDHGAGFGEHKQTYEQHETTWKTRPYDEANPGSYVRFLFRYRSRDFLREQGVLPDSPRSIHQKPDNNSSPYDHSTPSSSGSPDTPSLWPGDSQSTDPIDSSAPPTPFLSETTALYVYQEQRNRSPQPPAPDSHSSFTHDLYWVDESAKHSRKGKGKEKEVRHDSPAPALGPTAAIAVHPAVSQLKGGTRPSSPAIPGSHSTASIARTRSAAGIRSPAPSQPANVANFSPMPTQVAVSYPASLSAPGLTPSPVPAMSTVYPTPLVDPSMSAPAWGYVVPAGYMMPPQSSMYPPHPGPEATLPTDNSRATSAVVNSPSPVQAVSPASSPAPAAAVLPKGKVKEGGIGKPLSRKPSVNRQPSGSRKVSSSKKPNPSGWSSNPSRRPQLPGESVMSFGATPPTALDDDDAMDIS